VYLVVLQSGGRLWIESQRVLVAAEADAAKKHAPGRADGAGGTPTSDTATEGAKSAAEKKTPPTGSADVNGAAPPASDATAAKVKHVFRTVRSELPVDDKVDQTAALTAPEMWSVRRVLSIVISSACCPAWVSRHVFRGDVYVVPLISARH
jgi:hypothetical protein